MAGEDPEEGEIEEGEVNLAVEQKEQESGEASGYEGEVDDRQYQSAGSVVQTAGKVASIQLSPRSPGKAAVIAPAHEREMERSSMRGIASAAAPYNMPLSARDALPHRLNSPRTGARIFRGVLPPGMGRSADVRDAGNDEAAAAAKAARQEAADRAREEREREELQSSLRELTRYVSVTDVMRSLDTVCKDLKSAIKKLEKLFRKLKKKKGDFIEDYPDCFQHSKRVHEGLKSVNIVVNTSIGQTMNMEVAKQLFKAAMNYRHDVFSSFQKKELEGWVRSSRVLKAIIEEKENKAQQPPAAAAAASGTPAANAVSPKDATPPPEAAKSKSAGSKDLPDGEDSVMKEDAGAAEAQDAVPEYSPMDSCQTLDPSIPITQDGQLQAVAQAAAAADETDEDGFPAPPPLPPPPAEPESPVPLPPPPCEPPPTAFATTAEPAQATAATAGGATGSKVPPKISSAFKFKIVVESTAADIRKGLPRANSDQPDHPAASTATAAGGSADAPLGSSHSNKRHGSHREASPDGGRGHKKHRHDEDREGGSSRASHHSSSRRSGERERFDRGSSERSRERDRDRERERERERDRDHERDRQREQAEHSGRGQAGNVDRRGSSLEAQNAHAYAGSSLVANGNASYATRPSSTNDAAPAGHAFHPPESPMSADDSDPPAPYANGPARDPVLANGNGPYPPHLLPKPSSISSDLPDQHTAAMPEPGGISSPTPASSDGLPAYDVPALLSHNKLCLVLDLDHTLLNSARFIEVDTECEPLLEQRLAAEGSLLPEGQQELYRLERLGMWTKLRPGVREFLRRASEKFELWIHTNGNRAYADAMVELLDPLGAYFGGRILAQGALNGGLDADGAAMAKRFMAGLEGREPVAVILDDNSAVWPHDRRNLLTVERYLYFPASRKSFGMEGKSLLEINRDECPERGMLATAGQVLDRLHSMVFLYLNHRASAPAVRPEPHLQPWDVRNVMSEEQRKVLAGVHIVFSRIIPLEQDPRTHRMWKMAEQFGATCSTQCTEATTHVVAVMRGTEKTFWAAQHGKYVVTPAWLECSCILWKRATEDRFIVPH